MSADNGDSVLCAEGVSPPPYFHTYPCERKAKWLVDGAGKTDHPVCGVHARWYRKYGKNVRDIGSG